MGLLAYDPDRVRALRNRLTAATDELNTLRCDDPAAVEAMRAVGSIRSALIDVWLPLITRIIDNRALTEPWWHAALQASGERHTLVNAMVNAYGWTLQIDPLDDDSSMTPSAARALGVLLAEVDMESLAKDHERVRWLTRQFTIIARQPLLSTAFLTSFDAWRTFTHTLATEHVSGERPDIDAAFGALMAIWRNQLPPGALTAGTSATLTGLLPVDDDDVDLYVQALMVRALRPNPMTAAVVTYELLTEWVTQKHDPMARTGIDRVDGPGANAGDLLLPLFVDNPDACVWFTAATTSRPHVLFETLNDPALAHRVVLVGTHPANTMVKAAGHAVLAILDYFRTNPYMRDGFDTDGHPGEYGEFLGDLVAPWLLQFTMLNHDWDAPPGRKAALLRVALHDDAARQRLVDDTDRMRVGFTESLTHADLQAAVHIGALLNLVLQLSVNELVDDEIASIDGRFNLMWTVVGVASAFIPGGPLVGITKGYALAAMRRKLADYLDRPDPSGVRRRAERAMDVALTLAGADAVTRLYESWVADGKVAPGLPPPEVDITAPHEQCPSADYHIQFGRWRDALPGGRTGVLGQEAHDLLAAFIGHGEAQANCAEVAG